MSVPMIHGQNLESLQRMLGVPIRMKVVPAVVIERVLKAQKCMSRISLSEALPEYVLLTLCYEFEDIPKAVPTKYGHLKDGDTVYFKVNEFEWQPCSFRGVADPQMHTYHIHIWGENRTAPENMLRESHPGDVPVEQEIAAPAKPVALDAEVDADTEAKRDEELKAARAVELTERLKEQWPIGRVVDVAIPGEEFFTGKILGHGNGRWSGSVTVRPSTETGTGYRRVPVSAISASQLQPQ